MLVNSHIFLIPPDHYNDVIMGAMAYQITSLTIVYSSVYSGADQRKHQSSASLAFVRRIHRWPVNSPHKEPVARKMFPFDDVIMSVNHWIQKRNWVQYIPWIMHTVDALMCFVVVWYQWMSPMMTSSNGNIFRVTGHLCGEFTGHRWSPCTKASDAELWCFLWSAPEWTVE